MPPMCAVQFEEWECEPSASQLALLEAVREVLAALVKVWWGAIDNEGGSHRAVAFIKIVVSLMQSL